MIFADDMVICCERREKVETELERWRAIRDVKVSRAKIEYLLASRVGDGKG